MGNLVIEKVSWLRLSLLPLFLVAACSDAPPQQQPVSLVGQPEVISPQSYQIALLEHAVSLDVHAGLPATITVLREDLPIESMDALLQIDGRFLRVPMTMLSDRGLFEANFPTPFESLHYEFLIRFADKQEVITDKYSLARPCQAASLERKYLRQKTPIEISTLLREADALDQRLAMSNFLVAKLTNWQKQEEGNDALPKK